MHSAKSLKRKCLQLRYKITHNQLQKTLKKSFLIIFSQFFLQHFPDRPYPNVKTILAQFYITKAI